MKYLGGCFKNTAVEGAVEVQHLGKTLINLQTFSVETALFVP